MWDFSGGQWLGLCASTAEGTGLIPGGEPRSLILHGVAKKKRNMGDPVQLIRTQEKQSRAQSLLAEWSTVIPSTRKRTRNLSWPDTACQGHNFL